MQPIWNTCLRFSDREQFDPIYDLFVQHTRLLEQDLAAKESVLGWCDCCLGVTTLTVNGGPTFSASPSLRCGMVCANGINGRARLILRLITQLHLDSGTCALFEDHSALSAALERTTALSLSKSEFIDETLPSGTEISWRNNKVVQQDMTCSSYRDAEFDLVIHNDVLEHIPDITAAFTELYRILKPGGSLLFTVPFFVQLNENLPLAEITAEGSIKQLVDPPEYHGDPVRGEVLTFWHFGWGLLDVIRNAGFETAELLLFYDPVSGIMSDNHPLVRGGNVPPVAILARKRNT